MANLLLLVLAGAAFGRVTVITGSTIAAALAHATYTGGSSSSSW